ncbi:MAG: efflux RND transporter periplasmic adaptor subunit, partial [Bacteroidota bacterium]
MAKKKSGNRTIWILLIAIVVVLVVAVGLKNAGVIGKPELIQVEFTEANAVTIIETVTASGTVQPEVEISISPEVSGEIIELTVEEGDSVSEGDLLVRINPEIFVQRVKQAEALLNQAKANAASSKASLARTQANFERQKLDYDRQEKLHAEKVISDADWETAQANFKVAEQDLNAAEQNAKAADFNVENAQASLSDARENLNRTSIYAPASGTVSKLNVEQGERVVGTSQMAGTEMLRIANLMAMEVRVNVNENDIIRVHLGDTTIVDVDAYLPMDKQFKGIVTAIANTANDRVSADAVTEFEVKIRVLNSSSKS